MPSSLIGRNGDVVDDDVDEDGDAAVELAIDDSPSVATVVAGDAVPDPDSEVFAVVVVKWPSCPLLL